MVMAVCASHVWMMKPIWLICRTWALSSQNWPFKLHRLDGAAAVIWLKELSPFCQGAHYFYISLSLGLMFIPGLTLVLPIECDNFLIHVWICLFCSYLKYLCLIRCLILSYLSHQILNIRSYVSVLVLGRFFSSTCMSFECNLHKGLAIFHLNLVTDISAGQELDRFIEYV